MTRSDFPRFLNSLAGGTDKFENRIPSSAGRAVTSLVAVDGIKEDKR